MNIDIATVLKDKLAYILATELETQYKEALTTYNLKCIGMSQQLHGAYNFINTAYNALSAAIDNNSEHMYFKAYLLLAEYFLHYEYAVKNYMIQLNPTFLALHKDIASTLSACQFYLGHVPLRAANWENAFVEFATAVSKNKLLPLKEGETLRRKTFKDNFRSAPDRQQLQYKPEAAVTNHQQYDQAIIALHNYYNDTGRGNKVTGQLSDIHYQILCILKLFNFGGKKLRAADNKKLNAKTKGFLKHLLTLYFQLLQCSQIESSPGWDLISNYTSRVLDDLAFSGGSDAAAAARTTVAVDSTGAYSLVALGQMRGGASAAAGATTAINLRKAVPTGIGHDDEDNEVVYLSLASSDDPEAMKEAQAGMASYVNFTPRDKSASAAGNAYINVPGGALAMICPVHKDNIGIKGEQNIVARCGKHPQTALFKCCLTIQPKLKDSLSDTAAWCRSCRKEEAAAGLVTGTGGASAYAEMTFKDGKVLVTAKQQALPQDSAAASKPKKPDGTPDHCVNHLGKPGSNVWLETCECQYDRPHKTTHVYECCLNEFNRINKTQHKATETGLYRLICDHCVSYR